MASSAASVDCRVCSCVPSVLVSPSSASMRSAKAAIRVASAFGRRVRRLARLRPGGVETGKLLLELVQRRRIGGGRAVAALAEGAERLGKRFQLGFHCGDPVAQRRIRRRPRRCRQLLGGPGLLGFDLLQPVRQIAAGGRIRGARAHLAGEIGDLPFQLRDPSRGVAHIAAGADAPLHAPCDPQSEDRTRHARTNQAHGSGQPEGRSAGRLGRRIRVGARLPWRGRLPRRVRLGAGGGGRLARSFVRDRLARDFGGLEIDGRGGASPVGRPRGSRGRRRFVGHVFIPGVLRAIRPGRSPS